MLVPLRQLTAPKRSVPPSLKATIHNLPAVAFENPIVEPLLMTSAFDPVTEIIVGVPVAAVAFLNGILTGLPEAGVLPAASFRVMVRAFAETDAASEPFIIGSGMSQLALNAKSGVVVGFVTVMLASADATVVTEPAPAGTDHAPVPSMNCVTTFESFLRNPCLLVLQSAVVLSASVSPASGSPVQFVSVPLAGVPRLGVMNVGEVENAAWPVPVTSLKALSKFALVGVARKVAIPAAIPLTPLVMGNPVQFVSTPLAGVPSAGVTKAMLVHVPVGV